MTDLTYLQKRLAATSNPKKGRRVSEHIKEKAILLFIEKQWSRRKIAQKYGVHPTTVSRWLRNAAAIEERFAQFDRSRSEDRPAGEHMTAK